MRWQGNRGEAGRRHSDGDLIDMQTAPLMQMIARVPPVLGHSTTKHLSEETPKLAAETSPSPIFSDNFPVRVAPPTDFFVQNGLSLITGRGQ